MRWLNGISAGLAALGIGLWLTSEGGAALGSLLVAFAGVATLAVVNIVALVEWAIASRSRPRRLLSGDCGCVECAASGNGKRKVCGICRTPQAHVQSVWVCLTCDHLPVFAGGSSIAF